MSRESSSREELAAFIRDMVANSQSRPSLKPLVHKPFWTHTIQLGNGDLSALPPVSEDYRRLVVVFPPVKPTQDGKAPA